MKNIILEKYKLLNLGLLIISLSVMIFMNINYENWFRQDSDIFYIYKYYDGIYSPILVSITWLTGILAAFLFLPSRIFRAWLFYIAPVFLLGIYFLVQEISVYSTNLLNPTRGQMAENCMFVLTVVTVIFVAVHLFLDWKHRRNKAS